jgi:septum formation protein
VNAIPFEKTAWVPDQPLVLASASPIRKKILENAGIPVMVKPARINERHIEKSLRVEPVAIALNLAETKALTISALYPAHFVLGVDQILIFNDHIIHKSVSREAALEKLLQMSGKVHHLYAHAVLVKQGKKIMQAGSHVAMHMRELSATFLEYYADQAGAALTDTVGGYEFEKTGAQLFNKTEGDFFTILGLPLMELLNEWRRLGLVKK